jgi:3-methyl-2-oxobutanoate hydroxymethyltransferase
MNVLDFYKKKEKCEKIAMITCYDYTSARILANSSVDCLLVGDSAAMVMHGYKDTLSATVEMICMHTSAVHRGAGDKFIISDLPFLSYRKSLSKNVEAVQQLMQAGAAAVKLEGVAGNLTLISHLIESGVPVMGHLGLTPQFIQEAGCFALVLECVPSLLATEITRALSIPTIGIGAGPHTDGQVLVFQDLLGLNEHFKPKFVKNFVNGYEQLKEAVNVYVEQVKLESFPQHEHSFDH